MKYFALIRVAELLSYVASINLLWEERTICFTGTLSSSARKIRVTKPSGGISNVAVSRFCCLQ